MNPSLDSLADGGSLAGLSKGELAAILVSCAAIQARIAAALVLREAAESPVSAHADRLLDAQETARRLAVSPTWLYRRSRTLPFVVRLAGRVRFSERKLGRFIANRSGEIR
jgi:predicted DNA-binding transcriptional regulator AlpA